MTDTDLVTRLRRRAAVAPSGELEGLLTGAADELERLGAGPRLLGVGADGSASVRHWAVPRIAASFADFLGDAPNWRSVVVGPVGSPAGPIVVTVRRQHGDTPEAAVTRLRAEVGRLTAEVERLTAAAERPEPEPDRPGSRRDIVSRLRTMMFRTRLDIFDDAADEVEWLRAENKRPC